VPRGYRNRLNVVGEVDARDNKDFCQFIPLVFQASLLVRNSKAMVYVSLQDVSDRLQLCHRSSSRPSEQRHSLD
jgi:hypothetical protein